MGADVGSYGMGEGIPCKEYHSHLPSSHHPHVSLGRCGYTDLIPKLWVEKINAVIPESATGIGAGFHVRWHGLWMEVADGVSMENFLHKGR